MDMVGDEIFFKWSNAYSVNIPAIDAQHRELVNILNRLFVAVSKREGDKITAGIFDSLMEYTRTHFVLEEKLMKDAKYADFEQHERQHRRLMDQMDDLARKHLVEEKPVHFEMLVFLKGWLKDHIAGSDTKYSQALQASGVSTASWEHHANNEFAAVAARKKQWWTPWNHAE